MRTVHLMLLACLAVGTSACGIDGGPFVSGESVGAGQVVWDFRSPLTPADLGSEVSYLHSLEGPLDLRVVFPSGRVVEGVWGFGAWAESSLGGFGLDAPSMPVNSVLLLEYPATDIDGLRASAERFVEEWGPASDLSGTIDEFVERTERLHEEAGTAIGRTYSVGENVYSFHGMVQDGIQPTWSPRFVDDVVTIRVTLEFDPVSSGGSSEVP